MSFSFRHGDVAVHITVDPADGPSAYRPPGGSSGGETILYPPAHADLVLPVNDPGDVELHYRAGLGSWRSGPGDGEFSRYAGIPYGLLGRHLVMFLCTEAFRCRTRTITLHPHRVYAFLAALGSLSEQSVRGGWFTELEGQFQRILRHGWVAEQPGSTGALVAGRGRPGHGLLDSTSDRPPVVTLDAEFAKSALRWIPLDGDVVRVLGRHSCTALDVYAWLTYIGTYLDEARHFTWESVHARFFASTGSAAARTTSSAASAARSSAVSVGASPAASVAVSAGASPAVSVGGDPAAFRPVFETCLEEIRKVTAIPPVTVDASGVEIHRT
ncbi:hypothetical protein Q0Z83_065880 [Actinoplanes sichuanensis]|uniref:RepA protein n=1 Tax=Actinoplanes sichuanensis TaxID=512349 RepID=A0ABW4AP21_9ACTN|nr:hypothetical protein [Actinoplanes sichuanensis]BEL08397.1 hypothetical protein Q0Z83_065880 [Actinoplanes sichuanensis]